MKISKGFSTLPEEQPPCRWPHSAVRFVRKRAFTPRVALYMPYLATLNDEIFVDGRKGETGNEKGPEGEEREAALKYCFGSLLPRLLLRFYGRLEQ